MSYRLATPDDAETIARIHIAGWQAAYRGILDDELLDSLQLSQRTEFWKQRLAGPESNTLVALEGAVINGFCSCGLSRDADATPLTWEIYSLYISPQLRGQGIGSGLFKQTLTLCCQRDAKLLTLWVVEQNRPARRFYELQGMSTDGVKQSYSVKSGVEMPRVRYKLPLHDS